MFRNYSEGAETDKEEVKQLQEKITALRRQVAELNIRLNSLHGRVTKDSPGSHLPPSPDRFGQVPRSLRQKSSKKLRVQLDSLLLLVAIVAGAVLITHSPGVLWNIIKSTIPILSTSLSSISLSSKDMLPPGAALPGERDCAARVRRSSWEPRPDNTAANHSVPTAQQIARIAPWGPDMGFDPKADALRKQITGSFTGTTDKILQWVACKWGVDVNVVRAEFIAESSWHQSFQGDWTADRNLCPPGTWNRQGCFQSYGILQIKYIYNLTAWPMFRDDTAFNAEYVYGVMRACYEGWLTYLFRRIPVKGYPRYRAGDIWGCIGRWYSGGWYDQDAIQYISSVQTTLSDEAWLHPGS